MSYVGCVRVPMYVRRPFKFCSVGVPCADVARLKLLELLLRAEFVGLYYQRLIGEDRIAESVLGKAYHNENISCRRSRSRLSGFRTPARF